MVRQRCLLNSTFDSLDSWAQGSEDGMSDWIAVSLLTTLVCCVLLGVRLLSGHYWASFRTSSCSLPLPPGSMGFPIIGETITFFLMGALFYQRRRKMYGDVYKTHLLGQPVVRVVGAENVRKVLLGENTLVTSCWPTSVHMMLGSNTILTSSGDLHRALRRTVARAFTHEALDGYVTTLQQIIQEHLTRWCQTDVVQGYSCCKSLVFDMACRVLIGLDMTRQDQDYLMEVFNTWVNNLFSLPIHFPGSGLFKGMRARRALLQKMEECLQAKERQPERLLASRDAMSLLMRSDGDGELTREELKNLCLELMFAGHVTSSSAATSVLYFLARNPRVIERIKDELSELGLLNGKPGDLNLQMLSSFTLIGDVVKEVLRLAPPVGAGFRKALRTFELDGYQVPAGWGVAYSIRETQMFSDLYTNSDCFDPDRWRCMKHSDVSFNFLPFGKAARACPGRELARLQLQVFVVEVVRGCKWRLLNDGVELKHLPVPHPADGLVMRVWPWHPTRNTTQQTTDSRHQTSDNRQQTTDNR